MPDRRVRWYNRLAAWLYEHNPVGDLLMELAIPVWEEQAEADLDEMWEREEAAAAMAEDYRDARNVDLDPDVPF